MNLNFCFGRLIFDCSNFDRLECGNGTEGVETPKKSQIVFQFESVVTSKTKRS